MKTHKRVAANPKSRLDRTPGYKDLTVFDVSPRTIDYYIERYGEELRQNGYEVLSGKRLKLLKMNLSKQDVNETDFGNIAKVSQQGVSRRSSILTTKPLAHAIAVPNLDQRNGRSPTSCWRNPLGTQPAASVEA